MLAGAGEGGPNARGAPALRGRRQPGRRTACPGVCTCDGVGLVAGDLSRLADECLYEAKRAGRDTVRACGRPVGDR